MSSTPTYKQHTPYSYHPLPEEYRSNNGSPNPFPSTENSLGALTLHSEVSSDVGDNYSQEGAPYKYTPYYANRGPGGGPVPSYRSSTAGSVSNGGGAPPSYNAALTSSQRSIPSSPHGSCGTPTGGHRFAQHPQRSIPSFRSNASSGSGYSSYDSPQSGPIQRRETFRGAQQQQQQARRQPQNQQRQQQMQHHEESTAANFLTASFGSVPSALAPKRNTTFKAHFTLEKAGVPYHSFPNGGQLPTPEHWPTHCTIDNNQPYPTFRVFIGQVRFETTTEQIAWVLEAVAGIRAAFVAYHRNGCFVAHFFTAQECDIAVSFHKKVLFDLNGVWDVKDHLEIKALNQVLKNRANLHKHRLPRGCMVIEPFANSNVRNQGSLPTYKGTAPGSNSGSALPPSQCSSLLFNDSAREDDLPPVEDFVPQEDFTTAEEEPSTPLTPEQQQQTQQHKSAASSPRDQPPSPIDEVSSLQ